jgi:hypothetical protein
MCPACEGRRSLIKHRVGRIRTTTNNIKSLLIRKSEATERYSQNIARASNPSSKAHYRAAKTTTRDGYDRQIRSLRSQNESLRDQNRRDREAIRLRHRG